MLKSELIRPRIRINDGQVSTRPIQANYRYLAIAGDLGKLYQTRVGQTRGQLAEALRDTQIPARQPGEVAQVETQRAAASAAFGSQRPEALLAETRIELPLIDPTSRRHPHQRGAKETGQQQGETTHAATVVRCRAQAEVSARTV